jgi:hypothetical protein
MRWTNYVASTYFAFEWTGGWSSSTDEAGAPIEGSVGNGQPPPSGSFSVGVAGTADELSCQDPESLITSQVGCDPATVTSDTPATTITC